jgi:hypothetical protein
VINLLGHLARKIRGFMSSTATFPGESADNTVGSVASFSNYGQLDHAMQPSPGPT